MIRRFDIIEPAGDPRLALALWMFLPAVVVLAAVYVLVKPTPPPFLPIPIVAVMALQIVMIGRWIERRQVELDDDLLRVQAGSGKLEIAVTDLDPGHAKVLSLAEHPEFKPFMRTGGLALPGLALGWFRTRKLLRLFCLLTDRQRVLMLPARDGKRVVLLSLKRPDELLAALRAADDRRARQR